MSTEQIKIEPGLETLVLPRLDIHARFVDAIILVVVFLASQLVLGLLIGILITLISISINGMILCVLELGSFAIVIGVMKRKLHARLTFFVPIAPVKALVYLAGALGGFGLLLMMVQVESLLVKLIPMPRLVESTFSTIASADDPFGGFLFAAVVAPAVEEILFRGVILRGFIVHYKTIKALVLSAVIFGIVHLNPWQFVTGLVLGLFIGLLFGRTGSILPGLVVHVFYNGLLMVMSRFQKLFSPGRIQSSFDNSGVAYISALIIGIVLTLIAAWLIIRMTSHDKESNYVHSNE